MHPGRPGASWSEASPRERKEAPGRPPPGAALPLLAALVLGPWGATASDIAAAPPPIELDCRAGSAAERLECPEVTIEGDPWAELVGIGPSPFRGYGDPSVRKDPASDRLWMSYSYLDLHTDPAVETGVSIHLASSDDGGETWQFRRVLEASRPEFDPAPLGGAGVSVHEVSTIAPLVRGASGSKVRWFGMHLRYFQPFGPEGRRPNSFHFEMTRSRNPRALGRRSEARLGGPLTDSAWQIDLDLSSLDPSLEICDVWTEPALFDANGILHLVAQCLVIDHRTGARRPRQEFIGVFSTDGRGSIGRLDWQWSGRLTDRADAKALGGTVLTQPDLAWSRDGRLMLLVTPKRLGAPIEHRGCRVLEIASLEEPRLLRDERGEPIVRADIRSSDSNGLGPGLCAYDAASATGILFVRTEIDLAKPDIVFRLHATRIHP